MTNTNTTVTANTADVEKNKVLAILSYVGILCFLPLLAAKDSEYAMYHGNQGIWLFIAEIVLSILSMIPILGCIAMILLIVAMVFAVLGIINAAQGKMVPLPGFDSLPVLFK